MDKTDGISILDISSWYWLPYIIILGNTLSPYYSLLLLGICDIIVLRCTDSILSQVYVISVFGIAFVE